MAALLAGIGATGSKVLLLTAGTKSEVYLSTRNLPSVLVRPWGEASAYDVLWSDLVLVEDTAFDSAPAVVEEAPAAEEPIVADESVDDVEATVDAEPETAGDTDAEHDAEEQGGDE
jgi:hypothetical protein